MVDIKYLKRKNISAGAYKAIFSAEPSKWPEGVRKLINHVAHRINDGRNRNLEQWRGYRAIDLAYEVPFNQTTPTLVQDIMSRHLDQNGTLQALKDYGLTPDELFLNIAPPGSDPKWIPNPPVFFQIYIPIVKAYVSIRLAKIFNERNQTPLLPYNPAHDTQRETILCQVITDVVQQISRKYGYPATMRQAILQMLKYGLAIAFPQEEWHIERQQHATSEMTARTVTIREGLRYMLPDPCRMYYDLMHPLTSLNTDTGTEFLGHWRVMRYGDILDDRDLWNRKSIFAGTNWFLSPLAGNYFTELYPCQVNLFPGLQSWQWGSPFKREEKACYYNAETRDKPIFITEHYEKIIPKNWELGEYKYPVWHRFIMAANDTPLYVEPCAYTPGWMMGYDYDVNAGRNSSLGLELIPWQDHLGNILSQMILTAKQNLTKIVFYDDQQISTDEIRTVKNNGENRYRSVQFIPFDSNKSFVAGHDVRQAFFPLTLGQVSIAEMLQIIPTTLQIMERVLQISAQEAGSAATHQQSKEEIIQTGGAGTQRVALTCSYVDEGIDAWERQLYEATVAYRDPRFTAQVDSNIPNALETLQAMGFVIVEQNDEKITVSGMIKQLVGVEGFAQTNEGLVDQADPETAQVCFQVAQVISAQPALQSQIGAKTILALIQLAARFASPRLATKLNLRVDPNAKNKEIPPAVMEALKQQQVATMQAIEQQLAQPIAQEISGMQGKMAETEGQVQQLSQVVQQLQKIYDAAQAANDKLQLEAAQTQQRMQEREAEHQASLRRREEEHQQKLQHQAQAAALTIETKRSETAQKLHQDARAADQKLVTEAQSADLKLEAQRKEAAQKASAAKSKTE